MVLTRVLRQTFPSPLFPRFSIKDLILGGFGAEQKHDKLKHVPGAWHVQPPLVPLRPLAMSALRTSPFDIDSEDPMTFPESRLMFL